MTHGARLVQTRIIRKQTTPIVAALAAALKAATAETEAALA